MPKTKDIFGSIANELIVSQRFAELVTDAGLRGFELRPVRHKARYEDDPIDLRALPAGREILRKADEAGAPHPTWNFWVWLNRPENHAMYEKAVDEYAALKHQRDHKRCPAFPPRYQLVLTSPPIDICPPTRSKGLGVDRTRKDQRLQG